MIKEIAFHNEIENISDADIREKLAELNRFIEKKITG